MNHDKERTIHSKFFRLLAVLAVFLVCVGFRLWVDDVCSCLDFWLIFGGG